MRTSQVQAGGLTWRVQTWGSPSAPALLLLHGFTWEGVAWRRVAEELADRYCLIAPDLPGHGGTPWPQPTDHWTFMRVCEALVALRFAMHLQDVTLVGYSMGGRLALQSALLAPSAFRRLVLIGASPGLRLGSDRLKRELDDAGLATDLLQYGMADFLVRWEDHPIFAGMRRLPPDEQVRLRELRLQQDPAALARVLLHLGTGTQPCLVDRLESLTTPTLMVVGEEDEKFRQIAAECVSRLPRASLTVVPESGHAVPLERPLALVDALLPFLRERAATSSLTL